MYQVIDALGGIGIQTEGHEGMAQEYRRIHAQALGYLRAHSEYRPSESAFQDHPVTSSPELRKRHLN